MGRKKYSATDSRLTFNSPSSASAGTGHPLTVALPTNASGVRTLDFTRWRTGVIRKIGLLLQHAIVTLLDSSIPSAVSYKRSTDFFISFCNHHFTESADLTADSITESLVADFIYWLKNIYKKKDGAPLNATTQKNTYSHVKSVLKQLIRLSVIPPSKSLFPPNPFPSINKQYKGQSVYSFSEKRRLLSALKTDVKSIFLGKFPGTDGAACSLLALVIAIRAGLNRTPLIELSCSCLQPHPLNPKRKLLTYHKRRGNKTGSLSVENQPASSDSLTVKGDIVAIIEWMKTRREVLLGEIPSALSQRLWLYIDQSHRGAGTITALNASSLSSALRNFRERHVLLADNGLPLKINIAKTRKTFINDIYSISGDREGTAKIASHTPRVSDGYLQATPDMAREARFAGQIIYRELSGEEQTSLSERTPVARCSDNKNGEYATGDGSYCTKFIYCLRCKNMVVTADDLWRLYSFYWLLKDEAGRLPNQRWSALYSNAALVIENDIAPRFSNTLVEQASRKARTHPHPFWRLRSSLRGES